MKKHGISHDSYRYIYKMDKTLNKITYTYTHHAQRFCIPSEDQRFCSFQIWNMEHEFVYGNPETQKIQDKLYNQFVVGIIISPRISPITITKNSQVH